MFGMDPQGNYALARFAEYPAKSRNVKRAPERKTRRNESRVVHETMPA